MYSPYKPIQNHNALLQLGGWKKYSGPHYEENYKILIFCFWEWSKQNKNLNQDRSCGTSFIFFYSTKYNAYDNEKTNHRPKTYLKSYIQ